MWNSQKNLNIIPSLIQQPVTPTFLFSLPCEFFFNFSVRAKQNLTKISYMSKAWTSLVASPKDPPLPNSTREAAQGLRSWRRDPLVVGPQVTLHLSGKASSLCVSQSGMCRSLMGQETQLRLLWFECVHPLKCILCILNPPKMTVLGSEAFWGDAEKSWG